MRALDTNVLIRYLVQDDARQAKAATLYIEKHCTRAHPAFINRIVLCELVWVLESAYRYEKTHIANVLEKILQTSQFLIEDVEAAWQALESYKKLKVDYADALIGKINKAAGYPKPPHSIKKRGN